MPKMTDSERDNRIRNIEASARKMANAMDDISMLLKQLVVLKTLETMHERGVLTGFDYNRYLQDILKTTEEV